MRSLLQLLILVLISGTCIQTNAFQTTLPTTRTLRCDTTCLYAAAGGDARSNPSRRQLLSWGLASGLLIQSNAANAAAAGTSSDLSSLREKVTEARKQLDPVPDLIKQEKWDSIRAILITPPLSDCWSKSSGSRPLLQRYAEAIGESAAGDELAALEAREEALNSLRFLDMAACKKLYDVIRSHIDACQIASVHS